MQRTFQRQVPSPRRDAAPRIRAKAHARRLFNRWQARVRAGAVTYPEPRVCGGRLLLAMNPHIGALEEPLGDRLSPAACVRHRVCEQATCTDRYLHKRREHRLLSVLSHQSARSYRQTEPPSHRLSEPGPAPFFFLSTQDVNIRLQRANRPLSTRINV